MANREQIVTGLDIGSTHIRVVVGQINPENQTPKIIGVGQAEATGIRKGVLIDVEEVVSSMSAALEQAERMAGVPIEHAVVSIGDEHVSSEITHGVIAISKTDGEVTEDDVSRAIEAAQTVTVPANKEILHIIPKTFTVDDQKGIKDPVGMIGVRLEVEALIIYGMSAMIKNISKAIYRTGVEIDDLVLSPLAAATSVVSKRQKELGIAVIDIGGGTTGLAVFEEGDLLHTALLPIGSMNISNDLAIGLRTSVDVAEKVKVEYGYAFSDEVDKSEEIDLQKIDTQEEGTVSKHDVAMIIESRVEEIFEHVDAELRKVERSAKLPAGILLVGGGAKLPGIVDVAKQKLKLSAQVAFPTQFPITVDKVDDPSFATALGLILWEIESQKVGGKKLKSSFKVMPKDLPDKMKKIFKSFMP
ncbi:cell division protein FtsA [Patescibacteria group bacterium]